MFFDGWDDLFRLIVVGTLGYGGLVLLLRVTGKRTLSKMNAFDFIVTVAFGSILASLLLSESVSLSEGFVALALLCGLQWIVAFTSARSKAFQDIVKAEPSLLYFRGRYMQASLRKERVTPEEVLAAIRSQGISRLSAVEAVVLETDGSFSVIAGDSEKADTLGTVRDIEAARQDMSREDALAWFHSLPAVDPASMTGTWRGEEVASGHPLDGLLTAHGWYGKRFLADGSAHPLLFRDGHGGVLAMAPKRLPVRLALMLPGLARSEAARFLFRRSLARLQSQRPGAHLESRTFEGVRSAAMVYEDQPITDHFRQAEDGRLLGRMELAGSCEPYFFVLRRDEG